MLSGKTVLVTGAGGFIGSHLAEALVRAGAHVRALVHYNSLGRRGWLDDSAHAAEMEILSGDIRDADLVREAVRGCDTVFHLAALIGIPYSYHAPLSYVRTNVEGTTNVLQAAREHSVSRVVTTSTSEVYGTAQQVPIDEAHPLQGQSPYSASKIAADKLAEAYHCSFALPVATVRPFNVYGPRQSARAIVPTVISQCLSGAKRIRLGSLTPTRDLTFVDDTVAGFIAAAAADGAIGRAVNLGSGRAIAIGELARCIAQLCEVEVELAEDPARVRPAGSEVQRLLADASLARDLLGWQPRVSLDEGLTQTIAWLRENLSRYRPDEYTV